ncbi:hypothetical protein CaLGV116 [Clostera anastomosis granulovirus A]|uniref:Uncharacterized protein n=1 Tax=Clostera anastomosis granulovirus A TaxID=1986289 RepID=U5KBV6_9BBAC|nr:hypothetical protein CaLGV116 [Clostera anastomosis granulovirus Henan]AGQ20374.1 hypothetical protein CaLGV116 [Clostera anastomosis granulovirus Henan]
MDTPTMNLDSGVGSDSDAGNHAYRTAKKKRRSSLEIVKNMLRRNSRGSVGKEMVNGNGSVGPSSAGNGGATLTPSGELKFTDSSQIYTASTPPTSSSRVLITSVPHLGGMDLAPMQSTLNDYLLTRLGGKFNAYKLTHVKGDRAVGYQYFAHHLVQRGVVDDREKFWELCAVMRTMYESWATSIPDLYRLVVNLNGADPTKEMMNIINQSVYSVVRFVMVDVLHMDAPGLFSDLNNDSPPTTQCYLDAWQNVRHHIYARQAHLTTIYDGRVGTLTEAFKYYEQDDVTDVKKLSKLKILAAPVSKKHMTTPFEIII